MEETQTQAQKWEADMAQIRAATMKLNAETLKIQTEAKWYPFVVLAGVIAAAVGIVKLFA
jgi:DNA-binding IclR family transcriptional regulator